MIILSTAEDQELTCRTNAALAAHREVVRIARLAAAEALLVGIAGEWFGLPAAFAAGRIALGRPASALAQPGSPSRSPPAYRSAALRSRELGRGDAGLGDLARMEPDAVQLSGESSYGFPAR